MNRALGRLIAWYAVWCAWKRRGRARSVSESQDWQAHNREISRRHNEGRAYRRDRYLVQLRNGLWEFDDGLIDPADLRWGPGIYPIWVPR